MVALGEICVDLFHPLCSRKQFMCFNSLPSFFPWFGICICSLKTEVKPIPNQRCMHSAVKWLSNSVLASILEDPQRKTTTCWVDIKCFCTETYWLPKQSSISKKFSLWCIWGMHLVNLHLIDYIFSSGSVHFNFQIESNTLWVDYSFFHLSYYLFEYIYTNVTLSIYYPDHFSYSVKKGYIQDRKNLLGKKTTTVILVLVRESKNLGWARNCGIDLPCHLGQSLTAPLVKLYFICWLRNFFVFFISLLSYNIHINFLAVSI